MRLRIPDEQIDWRATGFWWPGRPIAVSEFAARRPHLFGGAFTWPIMVLRRSKLERNIAALAEFTAAHGLTFAPHGKTSMAPVLFQAQLDAGAWGLTAATANQVLAYRRFGMPRVLLANELLDATALRWIAAELDRDPDFEFLCYADSPAGVEVAAGAVARRPGGRPLRMLVERGFPGGRTGCRTEDQVMEVARAVAAAPGLELAGVAGYEGGLATGDAVRDFVRGLAGDAARLGAEGLVAAPPILSVGGSSWFDVVAEELADRGDLRVVLRSGAYVAHDDGLYHRNSPFRRAGGAEDDLAGALEIWAQISSVPEPGLAIATMGRREANSDAGPPVPRVLRRPDGEQADLSGAEVTALNDHHAYLSLPAGVRVAPGDLVGFGISHPCTAFDRWRLIPVVADDDTVVDVLRTYF
ncbi:alanine racemase [Spinactinospora alkalitolerans]|uniref:alanine racemase n=1 Tax=Spinactinospora alkalitolerans TaxID=687207 RepID=UPI0015C6A11B|nr:alanine racemase [Spinactinospora alkalitolerans]